MIRISTFIWGLVLSVLPTIVLADDDFVSIDPATLESVSGKKLMMICYGIICGMLMLYALFLGYSITITILYSLPIGLENEWYAFYSYLDKHQAIPYIDVREGYPPLGFLIYMPLYYAFYNNSTAFFYAFRALNGSLLIGALLLLYLISKSIFNVTCLAW